MPTRKDNTNVAPIHREQVFIPASGAVKFMQEFRKRNPRGGNLEIVSPEFDLLTGVRSIANLPKGFLKTNKLPQGENLYYRQLDKSSKGLERAKQVGVIDTKSSGGANFTTSRGTTLRIGKTFDTPFFAKGSLWYNNVDDMDVIVGKDNPLLDWKMITQHGRVTENAIKAANRRTPFYNGATNQAPTELFELYRRYPGIGYRNVTHGFPTIPITGLNTAAEQMKCGGRRKAQLGLDIREGGIAIPIAPNMYYMKGRSHDDGGIGIGPNNKNGLEVEGGEIVKVGKNDVKVFSSVPLLRGVSPAQLVMGGANPNKVFKAQEEFKDRNRINDDGTRYEIGGEKKSNSAIRTEEDKKVSARNRAIYSAVDATADYPTWWQAIGLGIGSNLKTMINPDSMNYAVTDSVADAAWRKRLGLSYDDKFLIPNKDGSVRLPKNVELEIPADTTMLKKRIAANEKFANQTNIVGEDWQIVQAMMKKDKEALDSLRHTYKTGEPVVVNEYAHNNRKLSKNGELMDNAINYKSPLNVMRNYTIQYDAKNKRINYWDTYDFNEFDWGVPGKSFEIKGSIPLKKFGGNMIYTINGNVKNGLLSTRPKAKYGLASKYLKKKNKTTQKPVETKQKEEPKILDIRNTAGYKVKQIAENPWIKYPVEVASYLLTGATAKGMQTGAKVTNKVVNKIDDILSKPRQEYLSRNVSDKTIKVGTIENPIRPKDSSRVTKVYKPTINEISQARQAARAKPEPKIKSIDKIYKQVIGNKEPRSIVGNVPQWTEISYSPTNRTITAYDASVEFHKRISNMLYDGYVKKYGKKAVDKVMKREGISKYEYGGRIKAKDGKFLKYKNGVFTDPDSGKEYDVDPEVFKMYGNTKESGVIPTDDYTKGTFDNARPQYYAEKRFPIAGSQSIAEKAGLARSGWSYADSPTFDYVPKINISVPTNYVKVIGDNAKKSTSSTPRRGESKSVVTTKSKTEPAYINYKPNKVNLTVKADDPTSRTLAKVNTSSTGSGKQSSSDGRWIGQYKPITTGDWIGLAANGLGSIGSYLLTKSGINKMPDPIKPIMAPAAKLKTRYNIEPQLTETREAELTNRVGVRRNTQSSNTSLAREQRLMNEARNASNTLYGQKEKNETQLINQDRLNRQSVIRDNVRTYNDYITRLGANRQAQSQLRISNVNNLISGLTGSVNNILGTIESRRATNNTIRAIAAANPNVDARLIGGFDYYIDPVTKKMYNKNQQYVRTING